MVKKIDCRLKENREKNSCKKKKDKPKRKRIISQKAIRKFFGN
tara:strand:- start:801 stop:929 length:129 start_codon:yes stop_codon:yes gene_type:complete